MPHAVPSPSSTRAPSARRRVRRGLPLLLVAVLALVASSCYPQENDLTGLVNANRRAYGLPEYQPNLYLYFKAAYHSADMAGARTTWHTNLAAGNPYAWRRLGENVGFIWSADVHAMNAAYLASPPHRANLLDWGFQYVGVGVAFSSDGRMFTTEEFMQL